MPSKSKRLTALEEIIDPVCQAHGTELVQVRELSGRGGLILQVTIDRARPETDERPGSGVTLEDCTAVSRDISTALDVHNELIGGAFNLEVSSPGLDRALVRPRDFDRFAGAEIKVKTFAPISERRTFQGVLLGLEGDLIELEQNGSRVQIPIEAIAKANLVPQI